MDNTELKRVTVQIKSPNFLFEQWLMEWKEKAVEKGSKMAYTFETALNSIRKYPLPFERGTDCKILKGFGSKLCQMLDNKLNEYKMLNGSNIVIKEKISPITREGPKQCNPQLDSGGFAILMALYSQSLKLEYPGFLRKTEIILHGKQFINSSFTKPKPDSFGVTWASMKILISKDLVTKACKPTKYSLTETGRILAKNLYENIQAKSFNINNINNTKTVTNNLDILTDLNTVPLVSKNPKVDENINDRKALLSKSELKNQIKNIASQNKQNNIIKKISSECQLPSTSKPKTLLKKYQSASSTCDYNEEFCLEPGTFDIILYVDIKETSGKLDDEVLMSLKKENIKLEVKDLKVGDFAWVCRECNTNRELVLPYIVERKRMDDFASSIKDKRYHEQKFRLKRSGIANLTYLVESYGKNQHLGLPLQTLYQAATYTALQENFYIKFTDDIKESIQYLANFSKALVRVFKTKRLKSCKKDILPAFDINCDIIQLMTFKEFNESSIKNKKMKITDLFVKILIQIKGMSVERALAITKEYQTPTTLKLTYQKCSPLEGEKLLSNIKYCKSGKCIGTVLSKTVYQFFNTSLY